MEEWIAGVDRDRTGVCVWRERDWEERSLPECKRTKFIY